VVPELRTGFLHYFLSPETAAADHGAPFTRDRVRFDVGFYGGVVLKLELGHVRVAIEKEGLAVTTVLW
jgi:hypothetical protein